MAKKKPGAGDKSASNLQSGKQTSSAPTQDKNCQTPDAAAACPIVGIGASAGGLEALKILFDAIPDEPGFAVVVIQHLDPTKKSYTPELLVKHTKMRVGEVNDDPLVKPNWVYLIPPGKYLHISQGKLHLSDPDEPRGQRRAIDFFLRSLADDQKQRAVGVILSGTGTDGTLGIKAIKRQGGMVIAQDPATAGHDGMPRSAINTGVVDYVLSPEDIPETLIRYARHPYVCDSGDQEEEFPAEGALETPGKTTGLNSILMLLRDHARHDFQNYKDKTLIRRTQRRMCLLHLNDYQEYVEYLREHPAEVEALVKDLLISVTDFFRDAEAWQELQPWLENLIKHKEPDEPIRAWVPGCATGEEPYSLAMLLMEELQRQKKPCPVQVFASDVDKVALEYARHGRYPTSIEADVSKDRLERFFVPIDGSEYYRVNKPLREAVVFAEQNLIADPPFSKLDLICCRNVLIYLKADVQEKIISMFHFALLEGGLLFLGSSETIGRHLSSFETIHKRWRLYRRIGPTRYDEVEIPICATAGPRHRGVDIPHPEPRNKTRWTHLAQQHLLDWLAPQAILVDRNWQMLYLSGELDEFLSRAPGAPSDHLLENCRHGLRTRLRGAVHEALNKKHTVSVVAKIQRKNQSHPVRITVRPLPQTSDLPELALVVFESNSEDFSPETETSPPAKRTQAKSSNAPAKSSQQAWSQDMDIDDHAVIQQMEEELATTRSELQAAVEQLETSNEEYKAANEEVMSINEEMQSTNEELETSKEELQSLNEELSTVNNQLASKVEELEQKHADLENLVAATEVATICLDTDLGIRWFTPAAKTVVRLNHADRGRPISDFAHDFVDGDMVALCRRVLEKLVPAEDEVRCHDQRYFVRRITPYRTDDHRIGGLVITFVDITSRKRQEEELAESERRLRRAAESAGFGTYDIDLQTGSVHWSKEMKQLFGLAFDEPIPVHPGEILTNIHPDDQEQVQKAWEASLDPKGKGRLNFECRVGLPDDKVRWIMFRGRTHFDNEGTSRKAQRMTGTALEVTRRKQAELELQDLNASLENQVAERIALLAMLQDITIAANQAKNFPDAAVAALKRICQFNGWAVGHAWSLSEDDGEQLVSLRAWHVAEAQPPHAKASIEEFQRISEESAIPINGHFVGCATRTGEPKWLEDVDEFSGWVRGSPRRFGFSSAIAFPVLIDGQAVAVLEFFSYEPLPREERFIEIMTSVGIQLGHVFRRQRLERAIDTATTAYQRYIAQELHDSVAQELTGITMLAEILRQSIEAGNADPELARKLQEHLREAGAQVRQLSHGLMPVVVDAEGLMHALANLAQQAREMYSVSCQFVCESPVTVDNADVATHLYRIAQEALQNAAKHSQADHLEVILRREGDEVVLTVHDNGTGIAEDEDASGQGWEIMQYRANLIGGELEIESADGHGVTITCRVHSRTAPSGIGIGT